MNKYTVAVILFLVTGVIALSTIIETKHSGWRTSTGKKQQSPSSYNGGAGADYADSKVFIGAYHNVFVGKVTAIVGHTSIVEDIPAVQFAVKPLYNIKGSLTEPIVLAMAERTSDQMLELGGVYVIGARYYADINLYTTGGSIYSIANVTNDQRVRDEDLLVVCQENKRVMELQAAYPNEKLSALDVADHRTYNSYASRCLDSNGELIDDTVQIANEKKGLPKAECVTRLTPEAAPVQTPKPTSAPTPIPTTVTKPKPPLPSIEPLPTVKPPPPLPTM